MVSILVVAAVVVVVGNLQVMWVLLFSKVFCDSVARFNERLFVPKTYRIHSLETTILLI